MTARHVSILEKFAAEAIRRGADQLEVEYKDRYDELSAIASDFGFGIGRLTSTSQDAATLRHELSQCTRAHATSWSTATTTSCTLERRIASASKPTGSDCAAPEDSPVSLRPASACAIQGD